MKCQSSAFCLLLLTLASCSREVSPQQSSGDKPSSTPNEGVVSIEARISRGTRFILYANDVWSAPQRLPVAGGEWKAYQFKIPQGLKSLRFDPTELSGADVGIRSIKFEYPGQAPRWMPLTELPKWLKYHSTVDFDASSNQARIRTTDSDMYIMSTVEVNSYANGQPK